MLVMYRSVQARIAGIGVAHAEVAAHMGLHPSALSAILHGRRRAPKGFDRRITEALDLLEAAERAAERARAEVLAQGRAA